MNIPAHIRAIGQERFDYAFGLATIELRKDSHFVGMDTIRDKIAFHAALIATGYKAKPFSLGQKIDAPAETIELCHKLLKRAIKAAK